MVHRRKDNDRAALEATLTAGSYLRSDMKDFGPSCFHSASRFLERKQPRWPAGRKALFYLSILVAGTGFEPVTFRL